MKIREVTRVLLLGTFFHVKISPFCTAAVTSDTGGLCGAVVGADGIRLTDYIIDIKITPP